MSRTVTLTPIDRRPPTMTTIDRVASALRSYWTGSFTLKDPALNKFFGYGARSVAGPVVNEFTMFTCAAVYAAINQISSDVSKLPCNLKMRRTDGGADDYTASKAYRLLKFSPNPEMRSMVFRQTITKDALVGKGGFAEIERDSLGRPANLWYLEPHRVQPFYDMGKVGPDGRRDPLRYKVDGDGGQIFEARDILHIHGMSPDGVVGFEMVQVAREAIGLALASQQFAAAFFGNGTRFGGVLSSDTLDLDDEQKEKIRTDIEALHAKADKAFRLLVLGAGFKFTESGVKPNEAQMKEIRDQQVMEIARFYNMPLYKMKLAMPGAVSYNSTEMQALDYYQGSLLNWITIWEQELDAKLISPLEWGRQYFKHNEKALLRGDFKTRQEGLATMHDRGVISANDWLALEDMNPQPGGQGGTYLVQGAMIPKDLLVELTQAKIEKEKKDAQPDPPPAATGGPSESEVNAIRERAERAEAIAEEWRAKDAEARERLAAAEASGTATTEELAARRHEVLTLINLREQFEAVARDKSAALEQANLELSQRVQQEADAREASNLAAAEASALAERIEQARVEAVERMEAALVELERARVAHADIAAAQALADEARSEVERLTTEATAAQSAAESAATELAAKHGHLRATESERDAAHGEIAALRKAVEAAEARQTAIMAANRGLILDAMSRMARRECQHAKSKQQTQDKLKRWLVAFPELHEAVCVEALLPAIRAHLAWIGSSDDPVSRTETFAREHIQTFAAQLRTVIDADPQDYQAMLDRVLTRWETERPNAVADAFLTEAVQHVRS